MSDTERHIPLTPVCMNTRWNCFELYNYFTRHCLPILQILLKSVGVRSEGFLVRDRLTRCSDIIRVSENNAEHNATCSIEVKEKKLGKHSVRTEEVFFINVAMATQGG